MKRTIEYLGPNRYRINGVEHDKPEELTFQAFLRIILNDGKCRYCDCEEFSLMTLEHIVPRCRGGGSQPENLGISCGSCNHKKGELTELEFLKYRNLPVEFRNLKRHISAMLNDENRINRPRHRRQIIPCTVLSGTDTLYSQHYRPEDYPPPPKALEPKDKNSAKRTLKRKLQRQRAKLRKEMGESNY